MTKEIDMTPTWEETASVLYRLVEDGDLQGKSYALAEMRRMGKLADIATAVLGGHRREGTRLSIDLSELRDRCLGFIDATEQKP